MRERDGENLDRRCFFLKKIIVKMCDPDPMTR